MPGVSVCGLPWPIITSFLPNSSLLDPERAALLWRLDRNAVASALATHWEPTADSDGSLGKEWTVFNTGDAAECVLRADQAPLYRMKPLPCFPRTEYTVCSLREGVVSCVLQLAVSAPATAAPADDTEEEHSCAAGESTTGDEHENEDSADSDEEEEEEEDWSDVEEWNAEDDPHVADNAASRPSDDASGARIAVVVAPSTKAKSSRSSFPTSSFLCEVSGNQVPKDALACIDFFDSHAVVTHPDGEEHVPITSEEVVSVLLVVKEKGSMCIGVDGHTFVVRPDKALSAAGKLACVVEARRAVTVTRLAVGE